MTNKSAQIRLAIDSLVNTSVQDMQSGLWHYGIKDLELLKRRQRQRFLLPRSGNWKNERLKGLSPPRSK